MIVFPNCKINLGLHVINKRSDGYHNIETVFYPLPFYDVLEVIQSYDTTKPYELFLSGNKIDDADENNLCVNAYQLIKKDYPQLPPVKIYLHKVIPAGAGLGGGSADGAFMLMLLNDKFNLKIQPPQLLNYAMKLGSDCSFFMFNTACFARERGNVLKPIQLNLSAYKIVLVNPGIHVSTAWAFNQVKFSKAEQIYKIIHQPIKTWRENLINNFEEPVFEKYPSIKKIKEDLYAMDAVYASMSGSGSTVFGIFQKNALINLDFFSTDYFVKELV